MLAHLVVLREEGIECGAVAIGPVGGDLLLEPPHLAFEREKGLLRARHENAEWLVAFGLDRLIERGERRAARDI